MYGPMTIPEDTPEETRDFLAQHVLSASEVAAALNVTQPTVQNWTRKGVIKAVQEKLNTYTRSRYSISEVVAVARSRGMPVHAYTLPTVFITTYDVRPLANNGDIVLYNPPEGQASATEWMSESDAARLIRMPRATLAFHRKRGILNPAIRLREHPSPLTQGVQYYADDVLAIRDDQLKLYLSEDANAEAETETPVE